MITTMKGMYKEENKSKKIKSVLDEFDENPWHYLLKRKKEKGEGAGQKGILCVI